MEIYCPRCGYEPQPYDRWMCNPNGCGQHFDTFLTHGQCPNCFRVFKYTKCPLCRDWSLHEDWYHDAEPVESEQQEEYWTAGAPGQFSTN